MSGAQRVSLCRLRATEAPEGHFCCTGIHLLWELYTRNMLRTNTSSVSWGSIREVLEVVVILSSSGPTWGSGPTAGQDPQWVRTHSGSGPTTDQDPTWIRTHHGSGPNMDQDPPRIRTHHGSGPTTDQDPPRIRTQHGSGPTAGQDPPWVETTGWQEIKETGAQTSLDFFF